ncbi:MAG: hypothetical protein ACETWK_08205 [Candidatus Aminicenantaceae bacterium]
MEGRATEFFEGISSNLCLCGKGAILKYFSAVTSKEIAPGTIAFMQSFWSKINFHPHPHFLLTERGEDQDGHFHKISSFDESLIAEFFSREVFSMLLHKELVNLELV